MHSALHAPRRYIAILIVMLGFLVSLGHAAETFSPASVAVYFSPNGGATEAVIRELNAAKTQVLVQAYSFASAPIVKALGEAHKRGVKILAVLDKSNETAKYSAATFLNNAGIPSLIDGQHAIAHSKVMVIDSATILTGSFNFTKAAEAKNATFHRIEWWSPDTLRDPLARAQSYRHLGSSSATTEGVSDLLMAS